MMRFLCQVSSILKLLTFPATTALQHCFKSSCHSALVRQFHRKYLTIAATVARRCPAYNRFTVLWFSFLSLQLISLEMD